jgi:hypothetical protein
MLMEASGNEYADNAFYGADFRDIIASGYTA